MLIEKKKVMYILSMEILLSIMIFLTTTLYLGLLVNYEYFSSLWSLLYTLYLVIFFIVNILKSKKSKFNVILFLFSIHFAFIFSYLIFDLPIGWFWPVDAYNQHLPISYDVLRYFNGIWTLEELFDGYYNNALGKIYFNSFFSAIIMYMIGDTPIATMLSMLILKIISTLYLYKLTYLVFRDKEIAFISILMYVLSPSIIFYTISFYKEAMIHLLVILYMYNFVKFIKHNKPLNFIGMLVAILILFSDRFYMAFFLLTPLLFYYFIRSKLIVKLLVTSLILSIVYYGIVIYFTSIEGMYNFFIGISSNYSNQADTNHSGKTIFIIDFIRIVFTPFFNTFKFYNYNGINGLLSYNILIHFFIMMLFVYGIYKSRLNDNARVISYFIIPLILFYILFAIIGPFNGRVRESFFPLFTIFSSFGIFIIKKKMQLALSSKAVAG